MPLFDDIETLEKQVQKVLNKSTYTSVANFQKAYLDSIIEALGDFSSEQLSSVDIDKVVKQALRDSSVFIDADLSAEIQKDSSKLINGTLDFYEQQGLAFSGLSEAVQRREAVQHLTQEFTDNMSSMRDELLDETVSVMKKEIAGGSVSRSSMAEALLEAADNNIHHANTNARMVVSAYNRITRDQVRQDAGLQHGYYYGDARLNTRAFCMHCIGRVFSLKQINVMSNGQGLEVKLYCGGWNCIHSWMWMEPDWDPELQKRFNPEQKVEPLEADSLNLKVPE